MRTTARKLTVFTLQDGSTITTRSALETRWAIFFNELRLSWQYEPHRIAAYLPDFKVEGLGYIEIKPSIDLLIAETSGKIRDAARHATNEKIFAFVGGNVSFDTVVMYQGNKIFAPTHRQMVDVMLNVGFNFGSNIRNNRAERTVIEVGMRRANRAKLDHFISVGKLIEHHDLIPAQRKIVREASQKLKAEFNR